MLNSSANSRQLESTSTDGPVLDAGLGADGVSRADPVSIVIPVHNERETLGPIYTRLTSVVSQLKQECEILFVNDGSTDGSDVLLDGLAKSDQRVKVIHLKRKFGQTAAMMAGFDYASGKIIITLDSDLQNNPADIPLLLAALEQGYDVCSGWRKDRKDRYFTRVLVSRAANFVASFVFGVPLRDYGCTLKAYRREFLQNMRLYGEMHRFIPVYAAAAGARITEVVVSHSKRLHGKSNYGLGRIAKVILDMIVLKYLLRYSQTPMYVFGGFGLLCIAGSFGACCLMAYLNFRKGVAISETPLPVLTVLLFLAGSFSILIGLIAEVLMRTYYESRGNPTYQIRTVRNLNEAQ